LAHSGLHAVVTSIATVQRVADRFVDAILAARWGDAATYYDSDFAPSRVLPQLAEIFTLTSHDRVGLPQTVKRITFQYPLRRGTARAYLRVEMSAVGLQWKVYDYHYGVDDETTSP
jgi:hypothetical protein